MLATLVVLFMAAMAAKASATVEVQNYNDPAGDPTTFAYQLFGADPTTPLASDTLGDGAKVSFGPDPAVYGPTYTLHAVLPAGWQTVSIICQNKPGSAAFTYDLAHSSVTLTPHKVGEDHYCAFTNRKVSGPGAVTGGGSGGGGNSGIAPTTPGGGSSTTSSAPALLRIRAGTHSASATIRIGRTSTIKGTLLWKGKTVGSARATHKAGTYVVKVNLSRKWARTFKRQGRKKVTLSLKIVVVGSNKATKVFSSGVIVRL
jgi:hypothetical protein